MQEPACRDASLEEAVELAIATRPDASCSVVGHRDSTTRPSVQNENHYVVAPLNGGEVVGDDQDSRAFLQQPRRAPVSILVLGADGRRREVEPRRGSGLGPVPSGWSRANARSWRCPPDRRDATLRQGRGLVAVRAPSDNVFVKHRRYPGRTDDLVHVDQPGVGYAPVEEASGYLAPFACEESHGSCSHDTDPAAQGVRE